MSVTCDRSVVFSGYSGCSSNKADRHDITEILLKVTLNTTKQTKHIYLERDFAATRLNKWRQAQAVITNGSVSSSAVDVYLEILKQVYLNFLNRIYLTSIRPIMEYGREEWNGCGVELTNKLEKLLLLETFQDCY